MKDNKLQMMLVLLIHGHILSTKPRLSTMTSCEAKVVSLTHMNSHHMIITKRHC